MKKIRIVLIAAVLAAGLFVLAGCATTGAVAPTSQEEFAAAVKAAWADYGGAALAYDAERYMNLWEVNAMQFGADAPAINTEDMRASLAANAGGAVLKWKSFDIKITKTWVDHELGWATGNYTWSATTPDGTSLSFDGKYQTVFRRQPDGRWKILLDCWNSNTP